MALTDEATILKICKILKIGSIRLVSHLTYYANHFTTVRNGQIDDELEAWVLVAGKFTRIQGNDKNYGANINPNDSKNDVRENLESLLLLEEVDWYTSGNSNQIVLERG